MTWKRMKRARWIMAGALLALTAAVFVGSVVAGRFRTQDPSSFQADLASGAVTHVADIGAADGLPRRGVFAQLTHEGRFCLWDAPSAQSQTKQGGCNDARDPLGGSAISASLGYEGGPAIESVKDARIIGLASPEVARVVIAMSDGSERTVGLRPAHVGSEDFLAFAYRIRRSDLEKGIGPTAVIARAASGAEIARQPTGIGA